MRRHALEILVKILRNVNRTIETTMKLESQVRLEGSPKQEDEEEANQNAITPEDTQNESMDANQ